jgi:hypothetical protein
MSAIEYTAANLKLILRTSEGFPTQHESSKAMVKGAVISPSRTGHAFSQHVRGVTATQYKTKFASIDAMAEALALVLKTPQGQATLQRLRPGNREPLLRVEIEPVFAVAVEIDGLGVRTFGRREFIAAGILRLRCVAILEGRARAGTTHLHVQTFYPEVDAMQVARLLGAAGSS